MTDRPYVINRLSNKTAELLIYEQIGADFWSEGVTAKQFASDLKQLGDVRRIDVRINSPGGSVWDGMAIYNALNQHPANVVVHIDGIALSMASGIAMAGDTVQIAANGLMMLHNPQGMVAGDEKSIDRYLTMLRKAKSSLSKAYEAKSGKTAEEIAQIMDDETWLTAEEAVEMGFADAVTEPLETVAASFDVANLPKGIVVPDAMIAHVKRFVKSESLEEADDMANTTGTASEPVAATIAELKALAGADSEFVLQQLEAGATVAQATNALNAKLAAKLKAAEDAAVKAKADADAAIANAAKQPPATPPQDGDVSHGVAPMDSNKTPGNTSTVSTIPSMADQFQRRFAQLRNEGKTADQAWNQVYAEHPEWKQALLAELGEPSVS